MATIPKPEIDPKVIRTTEEFRRHKKQRFWHIYFPMIIAALILIALMTITIMAITGNPGRNSKWASLLLIISIVLVSVFALIIAAILIFGAIYLGKGIHAVPTYSNMAKFYFDFISEKTKEFSDKITNPIIQTNGWTHGVTTLFHNQKNDKKE